MKHLHDNLAIEVTDLTVRFGDEVVLKDLNLSVQKGEIAALIGPNGAGKTTLVRALLGFQSYRGRVKFFGRSLSEVLWQIGYVPQKFSFDKTFPLTVREFLAVTMNTKDAQKIDSVLGETGMRGKENKLIGELSGGQMQRLLIARAILNDPKILFLDEPTTGVDVEGERGFYEIIHHLNEIHGTTILMISHEINMVYRYASQVICLNRDLFCEGVPKDQLTKDLLEKLYGGEVAPRHHHHDN